VGRGPRPLADVPRSTTIAAATVPAIEPSRRFRADIEGLRAVAVALVLLFHAEVPGFAGGYVGVDVFFVLSGYLITRLLLRERELTGTIRLGEFYGRRLRRLLPAAGLVIVATLVASRFLLPPLMVAPTATDGLWAAGWLANVRFIQVGLDYLAGGGAESPLLHYWSLAVEEQFYLLWPALILLVASWRGRSVERRVGWTLGVVVAASFVASVWLTRSNAVLAYYALHTRAWEFGIGAALSLAVVRGIAIPARARAALSWAGLAAIVGAGVTYTLATPFPGWTALLPVLGTAAVIVAGDRGDEVGAGRVLRLRPLQVTGRLSYSLYLWHWPVLVLGGHAVGRGLAGSERAGLLALSAVLAWWTYRLVEDPIRRMRFLMVRPVRSIAFGGAVVVATVAATLVVAVTAPTLTGQGTVTVDRPVASAQDLEELVASSTATTALPATLQPPLTEVDTTRPAIYEDDCFAGWTDSSSADCVYGEPDAARTMVLFGDSHAAHWFPPLAALADEHGLRFVVLAKASCPSMDVVVGRGEDAYPTCEAWRDHSLQRLAAEQPELIVFSNARTYPALDADRNALDTDRVAHLVAGQGRTIERTRELVPGARIALIGSSARPGYDVPSCLARNLTTITSCQADPREAVAVRLLGEQAELAAAHGVVFVDPTPWLCTEEACPGVIGEHLVYSDEDHLAVPFTESLAPILAPLLFPDGEEAD
jgi:peptidoglycan/LPS O-acetylase OafA/YrhL